MEEFPLFFKSIKKIFAVCFNDKEHIMKKKNHTSFKKECETKINDVRCNEDDLESKVTN